MCVCVCVCVCVCARVSFAEWRLRLRMCRLLAGLFLQEMAAARSWLSSGRRRRSSRRRSAFRCSASASLRCGVCALLQGLPVFSAHGCWPCSAQGVLYHHIAAAEATDLMSAPAARPCPQQGRRHDPRLRVAHPSHHFNRSRRCSWGWHPGECGNASYCFWHHAAATRWCSDHSRRWRGGIWRCGGG